jgi:subtilase family serine protease
MVKKTLFTFSVVVSFAFASCLAFAQDAISSPARTPEQPIVQPQPEQFPAGIVKPRGRVIVPPISDSHRQGVHTNYKIFVPEGQAGIATPSPQNTFGENPASLACVYKVGTVYAGCFAGSFPGRKGHGNGGWGAIAVVDAYDHPNVAADFTNFDATMGVPAGGGLTKVIANTAACALVGGCPANGLTPSCSGTPADAGNFGWDLEIDLDTQYAHAMAPTAKIILVEACTQNLEDLLFAELVAGEQVGAKGGGDVSNSWGYSESCAQSPSCNGGWSGTLFADDNYFFRYYWSEITYFASAGDSPGDIIYPSTSPWVVSAGGTTIDRDSSGNFLDESCWADSGGGFSAVEQFQSPPNFSAGMGPWTDYQYRLYGGAPYETPFRSTPDIAADADPNSGVYVLDTDPLVTNGWYQVGGTSVSSPVLAGIVNGSNNRLGQAPATIGGFYDSEENDLLYSQLNSHSAYGANFYDVKLGNNTHAAGPGYDQCTGVGTPRGHLGK